ncbi:hypothetical protein ABT298_21415 [Streptomyces sp. NPDC001034]|uniref:hypothetical protein n=1 Tax=Streptomyces sp. NPDC001034 TaxID=3154375 RepID=UPI0033229FB0
MSLRDFARSLKPGSDQQLAAIQYAGHESATDRASRVRREQHRARVVRDGDAAGQLPRRGLFGGRR